MIVVDTLTPTFYFPSNFNKSEILSLCRANINEDLEFVNISQDRIGMIIKNSKFTMESVEWIYQQNKYLFTQLNKATESLSDFQERVLQDQELISSLKKEVSSLKKIENDLIGKLEDQVQLHRETELKADKIIMDLQQQLAASINIIKSISTIHPNIFQLIKDLNFNSASTASSANINNMEDSSFSKELPVSPPLSSFSISSSPLNTPPTIKPVLYNSNSFKLLSQSTQQASSSPILIPISSAAAASNSTPSSPYVNPMKRNGNNNNLTVPSGLCTSPSSNKDLKINQLINQFVKNTSSAAIINIQTSMNSPRSMNSTPDLKNSSNSVLSNSLANSSSSITSSNSLTPLKKTIKKPLIRRNTIQTINIQNPDENPQDMSTKCRQCTCYSFSATKNAEWLCVCEHTSIQHVSFSKFKK